MAPVCQFLYIGTGKVMFGHIALQLLHLFLGGVLLYLRAAEPEAQPLASTTCDTVSSSTLSSAASAMMRMNCFARP